MRYHDIYDVMDNWSNRFMPYDENFMDWINRIEATNLFVRRHDLVVGYLYQLNNTRYFFFADHYLGPAWFFNRLKKNNLVTFEDVLQRAPVELQEKLLFHIDLFR